MDLIKKNAPVVVSNFRVFSSQPVTKTDEKKIVITYDDLMELKSEMFEALKLEADDDKRVVLESDVENRFMLWYKNKDMKKDYRDFIINEDAKISRSVHSNTSSV